MNQLEFSNALENPLQEFDYSLNFTPELEPDSLAPHKLLGGADISFKYFADYDSNLHLKGYFKIPCEFVCDRCASTFERNLFVEFDEKFSPRMSEESELSYDMPRIDLDRFFTSLIITSFPSKVLCKENCRGLCQKCGANLNEGDCGCKK